VPAREYESQAVISTLSCGGPVRAAAFSRRSYTMSVQLSEKAASEVKRIFQEQSLGDETVLRVGVQGGGCSGFSYSLNFDTQVSERDRVADFFGVKLAVDKKFDPYLDGTVIDFYDGLEKRGFVFNNPNVVKSCGCGSSFQV
jgi:iron-sulfur cluster assembly protein